jgi:hypothetical protein
MEVLFHFIFELFKIAILSCFYATIARFIFRIIASSKPESWFDKVSKNTFQFWFQSAFLTSFVLFLFMFTHYGNHGLGDSARVPIRHFKAVREINANITYIENGEGEQVGIKNFTFDSNYLYAQTDKDMFDATGDYIVWDLRADKYFFYTTYNDYINTAKQNHYPMPYEFNNFGNQYSEYWHGWRFFLLP